MMELKCLQDYTCLNYKLKAGQTTEHLELSDKEKKRLLETYPARFEKLDAQGESQPAKQDDEDGLAVQRKVPAAETKEKPKRKNSKG